MNMAQRLTILVTVLFLAASRASAWELAGWDCSRPSTIRMQMTVPDNPGNPLDLEFVRSVSDPTQWLATVFLNGGGYFFTGAFDTAEYIIGQGGDPDGLVFNFACDSLLLGDVATIGFGVGSYQTVTGHSFSGLIYKWPWEDQPNVSLTLFWCAVSAAAIFDLWISLVVQTGWLIIGILH